MWNFHVDFQLSACIIFVEQFGGLYKGFVIHPNPWNDLLSLVE